MTDEERLEKAKNIFPNIRVDKLIRRNNTIYCNCYCPIHGNFQKRFNDYINSKSGCTKCANTKKSEDAKKPISDFLDKAKKIHNYSYIDLPERYTNDTIIKAVCPVHGVFEQKVKIHLNGSGCPKCANTKKRLSKEDVINSCKDVWGDEYDYSNLEWEEGENIKVNCKIHGEFITRYYDFIKGHGCPKCSIEKQRYKEEKKFKEEVQKINNNEIIFPKDFNYVNNYTKVNLIYKGEKFYREPKYFLKEKILSSKEKEELILSRGIKRSQNRWANIEEELYNLYGDELEFKQEQIDYIKSGIAEREYVLDIKCKKHGWKKQNFFELRNGYGCPSCMTKKVSVAEEEIANYISTIYNGEIIRNDRTILNGKELDIYIPNKKIAIEYDGIYWHNNINNYFKYEECKRNDIRLIQITEWEWKFQKEKIKSVISNIFQKYDKKIFARKCKIKEISNSECKKFCDENHLQNGINSSIRIGLFYNNELVEVICLSKARYNNYEWELLRECSKLNYKIIGGKAKLMKYFERKYNPSNIISYCDKSKFSGDSYIKNGYKLIRESDPNYFYYDNKLNRFSRITFQKHKLDKVLKTFDKNLTEWDNMNNNGYLRVFDYGNFVFLKENNNGV